MVTTPTSSPGGHGGGDSRDDDADLQPLPSRSTTTKIFPLNSKRLTSQFVMSIAKAMRLPTKGSVEEIRLIIEGSLTEMEREPRNVQVEVAEDGSGKARITLRDSRGTFVEAYLSPPESSGAVVEQSEVETRDEQ